MADIQGQLLTRMTNRDLGTITQEQHEGRPLAELAPWLFPARDDLIVNKDSGVMACHEFEGIDTDGASKFKMQGLAKTLNKLLVQLQEEPLMFWWTVVRRRTTVYPESEFPDPVSQGVDDAMKSAFLAGKNYVNKHYLSTVLLAHSGVMRFQERLGYAIQRGQPLSSAFVDAVKSIFDDQRIFAYTPPELEETCEKIDRILSDITETLTDLKFRRLAGAKLGGFLHGMISPQADYQENLGLPGLTTDEEPDLLDCPPLLDEALSEGTMAPGRDFLHFSGFRQKFAVIITVKAYSESLELSALDRLYSVPGEITVSHAVRLLPRSEAEAHAEKMRNFHENKKWSWKATAKAVVNKGEHSDSKGVTNPGRENLAKQARKAHGEFTQGKKAGLYLYSCIICYGDTLDEADETAERVESVLRQAHLNPEREEQHAVSAFATSVPGMWKECARWKFFNSKAFSMIAPVHTITRGQTENAYFTEQTKHYSPSLVVLPTDYDTPLYFSTHLGDLGHGFLAGPSRSGKTVLANLLATMFRRYKNAQIIFVDKDNSSRIPILLQGGTYLDFSSDSGPKLSPIQRVSEETLEYTINWIELLLAQRGFKVGAEDTKDLEASLRATVRLNNPKMKRLSTVFSQLSRVNLRTELEAWVGNRIDAKYFDNEADGFDLSGGLLGIEAGKLLTNERVAIPAMDYVFERIDHMLREQRAQGIVRPTFIYLAEVWHLVRLPWYREKLNDWLKTLAKRCACVWMDTQSIEDYIQSGIFAAMRDNIPNRIYLPNDKAESESLRHLYRREFELTDNQIERIADGTQKRDYFFQQGDMSRMISLRFSPEVLATLRSDTAAQIIFDRHLQSGAPDWKERYIQEVIAL